MARREFRRARLAPHRLVVTVCAAGFLLSTACGDMPSAPNTSIAFEFVVEERGGIPVPDVYVTLERDEGASARGVTDALGVARLKAEPGDYFAYLNARHGAGFPRLVEVRPVPVSAEARSYRYQYGGSLVSGTVRSPEGAILDSGSVHIFRRDPDYRSDVTHRFRGGAFRAYVEPGIYILYASSALNPSPFPTYRADSVVVGRDTTLSIALTGHKIVGTILAPLGVSADSLLVSAYGTMGGSAALTDAGGMFEHYLNVGSYRWQVKPATESDRWIMERTYPLASISGPTSMELDLSGTFWSGTLRQGVGGAALSDYPIYVVPAGRWEPHARCISDAGGGFRFLLERDRDYDIQVNAPGGGSTWFFRMPRAGPDSTFDLVLEPGASFTGSRPTRTFSTPRLPGAPAAAE